VLSQLLSRIVSCPVCKYWCRTVISEHVSGVNTKCAQSLHAPLKILRSHGMCDDALNVIYKAVVIAKVLHAIPVWWGFTAASDRRKVDAFIRRGVRLKFYNHNDSEIHSAILLT